MKTPAIVPYPRHLGQGGGEFQVTPATRISANCAAARMAALNFQSLWHRLTGMRLEIVEGPGDIVFRRQPGGESEGYKLTVTSSAIELIAPFERGLRHGAMTLLQCADWTAGTPSAFPALEIADAPAFGWRGLMLDSARYYQPVAFLKKLLDLMALYKFNVFHWHLAEDQGWRFESVRYPLLNSVSAWRAQTRVGHESHAVAFDGRPHGGFYTREEMKDLVSYAAARGIDIVPEIEMPGHCQEVLAAYPELSCTGGPFEVSTGWGIHKEVYCAGNDAVFEFLENILDEVLEIFPSAYIHIGGDECPKDRWQACPKCQARIAGEGLADEHELQSYFVRRIERHLTARGRKLIGWDEILEGGLAPGATVMSWRGEEGGIAAAQQGHNVVMAPCTDTYFDYYQSETRSTEPLAIGPILLLDRVYNWRPVPAELTSEQALRVLGGQGQLWTEYMPKSDSLEYMAFPRACALAECVWTNAEQRDFVEFTERLARHLPLLDRLGVNYRALSR